MGWWVLSDGRRFKVANQNGVHLKFYVKYISVLKTYTHAHTHTLFQLVWMSKILA